jgi:hypothetical protein
VVIGHCEGKTITIWAQGSKETSEHKIYNIFAHSSPLSSHSKWILIESSCFWGGETTNMQNAKML